jgi:hypothetical protein
MYILIITLSFQILKYLLLQHLTTLLNTFKYFDYIMHMYCFRCGTVQIVVLRVLVLLCTSIIHNSTKGMPRAPPLLIVPYVR